MDSWIAGALKAPRRTSFILDFDGSLSLIVEDPGAAAPVEGASDALARLAASYGSVAIVTGRRAEDAAARLKAPGLRYLGLYGAEELTVAGLVQHPGAEQARGMASRLARDAEAMLMSDGLQGCLVEYKDLAVSIHHRTAVHPDAEELIYSWASAAAGRRGMMATKGRKVVELRPMWMTKASAVESLLSDGAFSHCLVAGDDVSDLEAMFRAQASPGVEALKVGVVSAEAPEELVAAADVTVSGPDQLLMLLMRLL